MHLYPSLADQDWDNRYELQKQVLVNQRKPKLIDAPAIIWQKKFETSAGQADFLRIIQELSDYMLLNRSNMYTSANPNTPELIDIVKGKIDSKQYHTAAYTYGDRTNTPIRDNHFFESAKNKLISAVYKQPFEFSVTNTSKDFSGAQARKAAKKAAKMQTNLLAEFAAAAGHDLSFIEDPSVDMSGSVDEILSRLKPNEQTEYILYRLLQNVNYNHDIRNIETKCFDNKFDVNAEFARVEVIGGDVRIEHLDPHEVLWVAGDDDIETLEHPSVVAACVNKYRTFTEIYQRHRFKFNSGTGAMGLLDAIKKLQKGNMDQYTPDRPYFTEFYQANGQTSDYCYDGPTSLPNVATVNYNQHFYPFVRGKAGLSYKILDQDIFWKMIVPFRYIVEINGKRPTEAQFKEWQTGNYSRRDIAKFTKIDPEEKAPAGKMIKEFGDTELWHATRLGHACVTNVGKWEYNASSKTGSGYYGFPIVAQISYKKSFAYLGQYLAYLSNILFNRIEELLVASGINAGVVFDESIDKDSAQFLYHFRKQGIAYINSQRNNGGNKSKYQHLDTIVLPNHIAEVNQNMELIGLFKILYENMIGASPQAQGVAQAYSGLRETQMNIENQSDLALPRYREHSLFMNQLLQRAADIIKVEFAKDEYIHVRVSEMEHERLKLNKDLKNADVEVVLRSGPDLKGKKELINNAVNQLMASGGIEMLEPLIEIYLADNPNEALSILRKNADRLIQLQNARDKQMAEANLANAQAASEKNQIPLAQEKIKQETAITVKKMDVAQREKDADIRGHMTDIHHYQDQENKLLDSDLRKEEGQEGDSRGLERDLAFAQADRLLEPQPTRPTR